MELALQIAHIIVSILFVVSVLVQQRGSGLGAAMTGQVTEIKTTKRGAEKVVVNASIVLAVLFVLISVSFIFVP